MEKQREKKIEERKQGRQGREAKDNNDREISYEGRRLAGNQGERGEASKKGTDPVLVLPMEHGSENP